MLNRTYKLRKIFSKPLRLVSILTWLSNIVTIPYGLINAGLLSEMISAAIGGEISLVLKLSAVMIGFTVLYRLILFCFDSLKSLKDMRSTQRCKMILYENILASPLHLLFSTTNGDILENLTDDFDTVTSAQKRLYPELFTAFFTVIIYSVSIGTQSLLLALALFSLSFLQIIPPMVIRKYMQINYDRNRNAEAQITDFTVAGYEGMATIKLFSLERWFLDKLKHIQKEALCAGRKAEKTGSVQAAMTSLVSSLLQYGMYIITGIIVFASQATIETGIQAIALSGGLFGAVRSIFGCIPKFSLVRKSEERLSKWFSHTAPEKEFEKADGYALLLENISYQYDSKTVLDNVNFKLKENELVLLKGKNGTGKTTFLRIITGLLPLQKGRLFIDSGNLNEVLAFWCDVIFYLPQEDIAFDMTTMELCEMLKRRPGISDFEEWGLTKTLIESSNISDLSGGERKKVYLTIAFVSNPRILILDEPSNSLDTASKEILCKKLLGRSGATLVITHDERLDALACKKYRLEEGKIRYEECR